MDPFLYSVPTLGEGGINEGAPLANIADNEFAGLSNFYPFQGQLRRRGGTKDIVLATSGSLNEQFTGIFQYIKTAGASYHLMFGGRTSLWRKSAASQADLLVPANLSNLTGIAGSSLTIPPSDELWTILQYKDIVYWLRKDRLRMLRSVEDFATDAGLVGPATAPTLADGAAGQIPAASFRGVSTCFDTISGDESNPSPPSNILVHGANKKIAWSGLVSCSGYANARRLYRTLPDQTGAYFRVTTLDNMVTSYSEDNSLVEQLGPAASFDNGLPPDNLRNGDFWRERLFAHDGKSWYFSQVGQAGAFGATDILEVFPDDGGVAVGTKAFGDRLLMGKSNGMHFLLGTDPTNFEIHTLSNKHGLAAAHSLQVFEGLAMWFGGDDFYVTDGNAVEAVSKGIKIRNIINGIPKDRWKYVTATVIPERNWYVASVSFEEPGFRNQIMAVYNYKADTWATFTWRTAMTGISYPANGAFPFSAGDDDDAYHAPVMAIPVGDGSGRMFAIFSEIDSGAVWEGGHAFLLNDTATLNDVAQQIDAVVISKAYTLGLGDTVKAVRRIGVGSTIQGNSVNFTAMVGWSSDAAGPNFVKLRTVVFDPAVPNIVRWINIANLGQPKPDFMIGLLYQGGPPIFLSSLFIEGVNIRRKRQPL